MNYATDKLNIILISLSAWLAFLFPLELFIFAYAILGPLHYITEINWLNNKSYFFSNNNLIWLFVGVIASLILFVPKLYIEYGNMDSVLGEITLVINSWSNSAIFISLLLAIGYQFVKSKMGWIVILIIGLLGSIILNGMEDYNFLFGLMIPTIIHVYFFTLIFMLYGAKKSKSLFGYVAVLLAMAIPIILIYIPIERGSYLFSDTLKELYVGNNFHVTPVLFAKFLGLSDGSTFYFYETLELKLMMFMSFIYCYHYLNWFSKTTVIKWHKMLNLYKSIAIVEFPLNILSIKGIFGITK